MRTYLTPVRRIDLRTPRIRHRYRLERKLTPATLVPSRRLTDFLCAHISSDFDTRICEGVFGTFPGKERFAFRNAGECVPLLTLSAYYHVITSAYDYYYYCEPVFNFNHFHGNASVLFGENGNFTPTVRAHKTSRPDINFSSDCEIAGRR